MTEQAPATAQERTVADIPDGELLRRAVMSARDSSRRGQHARWIGVMHTFQLRLTYALQLCERFGLDPDEIIGSV